jgi:hypothetical protein
MKTDLQKQLAKVAPNVSIETYWSHDPDFHDIRKHCDGFDNEDPEDWQAWQSEIRATCIIEGETVNGFSYLGGTWEKADDAPEVSNPTISGYERQMTEEALRELGQQIADDVLSSQIIAALRFLDSIE